ncbi:MAG: hypothetical protein U0835_24215 [Isosphaeraceae bacterium]
MTRMSTRSHGVLDLLTVGTLAALPRVLGCGDRTTRALTALAAGSLGYSLLTRYEIGLFPVLPMRAHLALDVAAGAWLCASPTMFAEEDASTHALLIGLGVLETGAALLTSPEPYLDETLRVVRSLGQDDDRTSEADAAEIRRSFNSAML